MNIIGHSPNKQSDKIPVSVIIPAYNAAKHLDQCLNSVLGQTLKSFEVIIVNDASTDDTEKLLQTYVSHDKRCRLLNLKSNRGLPAARNAGVELANGEYLVHLDSDDFWLDSRTLEILYTTASLENTEILRFNGFDFVNDDLAATVIPSFPAVNVDLISTPQLWIFRSVFLYFFKTDFIRKHKLNFDERIGVGEDAIFLSKALPKAARISSIPAYFYAYRRHTQSMMGNHWTLKEFIEDQSSSDIVIDNLQDIPEIAQFYVFSRYTDYWMNKLLPRAAMQLDRKERHDMYDKYRKTLQSNKTVFRSRSRLGIKFRISKWLLIRGKYRLLDYFIVSLNPQKKLPAIYPGYYLNLAVLLNRRVTKFKLSLIGFIKRSDLVRSFLRDRDENLHKTVSVIFENEESLQDYNFCLESTEKKPGITAMIRVKNEEKNIVRSIESILPFFDEIVIVDNASTDRTKALVTELASKLNNNSLIKIVSYPFTVARCGSEHAETSENSVHNLAYYYNWCLSQCKMSHVVKWDADMVFVDDWLAKIEFQSYLRSLMTETLGALGAFCVQTLYLDGQGKPFTTNEEIHSEVRFFPNEPNIYFKKGKDWEFLHHPRFRDVVRSDKVFAYEIKDTREDEFDHWATNSFTGWRKSLEYRNYLLVQAGLQPPYRNFKPVQGII